MEEGQECGLCRQLGLASLNSRWSRGQSWGPYRANLGVAAKNCGPRYALLDSDGNYARNLDSRDGTLVDGTLELPPETLPELAADEVFQTRREPGFSATAGVCSGGSVVVGCSTFPPQTSGTWHPPEAGSTSPSLCWFRPIGATAPTRVIAKCSFAGPSQVLRDTITRLAGGDPSVVAAALTTRNCPEGSKVTSCLCESSGGPCEKSYFRPANTERCVAGDFPGRQAQYEITTFCQQVSPLAAESA